MISVILKEGISYKTCIACKYETASVEKMLKHLNNHRLDEQIVLQMNPMVYERVNKNMK